MELLRRRCPSLCSFQVVGRRLSRWFRLLEIVPIQSISNPNAQWLRSIARQERSQIFAGKFLIAVPDPVEFDEVLPAGDSVTGRRRIITGRTFHFRRHVRASVGLVVGSTCSPALTRNPATFLASYSQHAGTRIKRTPICPKSQLTKASRSRRSGR